MHRAVISGSGLYAAPDLISNEELVAAYNEYARRFNADNAERIAGGEVAALEPSSVEFIEKASGIRQRRVVEKSGVLDPQRMRPRLTRRPDEALSLQAEMAVAAAREALANAGRTAADIDLVICAASAMQRAFPAIAIEVQHALGIAQGAFDDAHAALYPRLGNFGQLFAVDADGVGAAAQHQIELCAWVLA